MPQDFIKIYDSFFTGSMRLERVTTRIVFMALCIRADAEGFVHGTDEFLAMYAAVKEDAFKLAVECLEKPDPHSTTPDEDGRRIIRLGPNRLKVVNLERYRAMDRQTSSSDKAAYMREYRARKKEAEGDEEVTRNLHVTDVSKRNPVTPKGKERKGKERKPIYVVKHDASWSLFLELYPKAPATPGGRRDLKRSEGRRLFDTLLSHGESLEEILTGVGGYAAYCKVPTNAPYVKMIPTFLRGRTWEEYQPSVDGEEPKAAMPALAPEAEPVEGVDFETRRVTRYLRVAGRDIELDEPYIIGTDIPFDKAAWAKAKHEAEAAGE